MDPGLISYLVDCWPGRALVGGRDQPWSGVDVNGGAGSPLTPLSAAANSTPAFLNNAVRH